MRRPCTYQCPHDAEQHKGWLIGFITTYYDLQTYTGLDWRPEPRAVIETQDGSIEDWPLSCVKVDRNDLEA